MKTSVNHIGVIGYGNVGSHLSKIFSDCIDLKLTIYNRSQVSRRQIPKNAILTHSLNDLSHSDFIIIAVNDDAIVTILNQIKNIIPPETIVCHCSGSISSSIIKAYFDRYGVLYPLQTFSKGKEINYSEIPVFITGSDPNVFGIIEGVASHMTRKIYKVDDNQRTSLHIAAVFCCNYTNTMYTIGEKICKDHGLEFRHLLPLIKETADKVNYLSPKKAQTGPAVRRDRDIIDRHESYLSEYNPQINAIYNQLAEYINKNL